jgi:hypothetical protein
MSQVMTSSDVFTWGLIALVGLGVAYFVWKLWSDRQADSQYARLKAGAGTDVNEALQGMSFTVGTPSEFNEAGLVGHFGWLSGERAWGVRLGNPKSSLRSLEGTSIPMWILQGEEKIWVRHPDGSVRLRAYNNDVSLVLPKGLKDGDQIRLGEDVGDRVVT